MWTREGIKTKAKEVLAKTYWMALIMSLIIFIAGAKYSFSGSNNNTNNTMNESPIRYTMGIVDVTDYKITIHIPGTMGTEIYVSNPLNPIYNINFIPGWSIFLTSLIGFAAIVLMLLRLIMGYHIQVRGYKFFINTAGNKEGHFSNLSIGFESGSYWNILKTMFLRDLYTFLWTLVFVIPGIIKQYSYAFVPYILAENPKIESVRAMQISVEMTQGHKMDMFILNLSFWGWYLLSSIAFGIGIIFVWPYENAAYAQLYLILKKDAIVKGIADECELIS